MIYVDTSALLSIMDVKDNNHAAATECWKEEVGSANFIINSYSMLETIALVQSRLGLDAVRTLVKEILPIIEVDWLGSDQHEIAINSVLIANRRNLSLVDCSSFETIRRLHIETVFTFDDHFKEQGFTVIP
jgi:predicted nucleic acid-binding protein